MLRSSLTKLAVIAAIGGMSQAALADGGVINFTGSITDSICSVAPESQNMTVPLGDVSIKVFPTVGTRAPTPGKFTINLKDCPAGAAKAKVTFTGTPDPDNATLLKTNNAGSGVLAAQGVGIEIGDFAGTKIDLASASGEYQLGQGDNNLKFEARYVSTLPVAPVAPSTRKIAPGEASGTAQFTVAYN